MAKCSASLTLTHVLDGSKGDPGIQGPPGEKGADARTYATLSSGYDLNDCKAKDTVYVTSSTAICNSLQNRPDGFIAGECRLEVEWLGSDGYFIQRLFCKAGDASKSFSRTYSSGTFGSWVELGTKGDKGDKGGDGTPAKVCFLTCNKSAVVRNDRSSDSEIYILLIDVQGYSSVPTLTVNGTAVSLKQTTTTKYAYLHTVPYKGATALSAVVSIDGTEMDSLTLSVLDKTIYYWNFGAISTSTANSLANPVKGDTYVDTNTNRLMYYTGTEWKVFSLGILSGTDAYMAGQLLSSVEETYWNLFSSMTDDQKQELFNLYGYKAEVISRFIASERIQMYGDGVIASSLVSTNPSETIDGKGFLTSAGYRLEGNSGIIRAKNAYLSSVYIDALSKIYGEIDSDALETHNGSTDSAAYESNTTGNETFFSYSQLKSAMVASNNIVDVEGTYDNKAVSKYSNVTNSNVFYGYTKKLAHHNMGHVGTQYEDYEKTDTLGTNVYGNLSSSYTNEFDFVQNLTVKYRLVMSGFSSVSPSPLVIKKDDVVLVNPTKDTGRITTLSVALPPGSTLTITSSSDLNLGDYYVAEAYVDIEESPLLAAGIDSTGIWLYYSSTWNKIPSSSYQRKQISILGVQDDFIRWEDNCYKQGESSPTTSGQLFGISQSNVAIDSKSYSFDRASWNSSGITFGLLNGGSVSITKDTYFKSFSFSFSSVVSSSYVKTKKLLPKDEVSTIGEQSNPWKAVYARNVFGLVNDKWVDVGNMRTIITDNSPVSVLFVSPPNYADLNGLYGTSGTSENTYYKNMIKWICSYARGKGYTGTVIAQGNANPNSKGVYFLQIYSTSNVNDEGLPRYCSGWCENLGGFIKFKTYDFVYSVGTSFYGNVNLSGTSYKVYGAVFN